MAVAIAPLKRHGMRDCDLEDFLSRHQHSTSWLDMISKYLIREPI